MEQNKPSIKIINHVCKECGFVGGAEAINGKVKCPSCGTVNDVWLLGETPPPNHLEEPATGEIVRALRCVAEAIECKDCRYKYPVGNVILCDHEQMNGNAADRLESQEAQIKQLTEALAYANEWHKESVESATNELRELSGIAGELEAMTERAEQAERERDAAIAYMKRFGCLTCAGQGTLAMNDPCGSCRDKSKWKMRGLPQEGDKDE